MTSSSHAIYTERPDALGLFLAAANGNYRVGQTGAMSPLFQALYAYDEGREVTPIERITVAALIHDLIMMGGALLRDLASERGEAADVIVADALDYCEAREAAEGNED